MKFTGNSRSVSCSIKSLSRWKMSFDSGFVAVNRQKEVSFTKVGVIFMEHIGVICD